MQHFYLHVALSLKISTYYILKYFFAETVGHIMRAVSQGDIWIETVNPIPGKKIWQLSPADFDRECSLRKPAYSNILKS